MEKFAAINKHKGTTEREGVQVVANIQIQEGDSVDSSNMVDESSAECYVGHVTHLRSKMVSIISGFEFLFIKKQPFFANSDKHESYIDMTYVQMLDMFIAVSAKKRFYQRVY